MKDLYHSLLKKIAHFQVEHPIYGVLIILFFTMAIYGGVSKVQTVASLEQMMPMDIEEISAFNTLRDNNLGQDMIAIVIELNRESSDDLGVMNIEDERVINYVRDVKILIEKEMDIREVYAITDMIEPNSTEEETNEILKSDLANNFINADKTKTVIIATTMIIFGTFTSALVPIVVVTISVNWLYGTMGYAGLPISTLAGGVAAMVIGIGIDFAIHIMSKFKYERKKGLNVKDSIELAVVETGTALTATSLTTIAAFLAFLTGVMPEMGRFGILMAIGIIFSLIFSLFGLPALLVLEEKGIYYVKNKLNFGVEGELHLSRDKK